MQKNTPETSISYGRVRAAIWMNSGEKGPFRSVTFTRSYKDERGEYCSSTGFSALDLLNVIRCAVEAMSYISFHEKERIAA